CRGREAACVTETPGVEGAPVRRVARGDARITANRAGQQGRASGRRGRSTGESAGRNGVNRGAGGSVRTRTGNRAGTAEFADLRVGCRTAPNSQRAESNCARFGSRRESDHVQSGTGCAVGRARGGTFSRNRAGRTPGIGAEYAFGRAARSCGRASEAEHCSGSRAEGVNGASFRERSRSKSDRVSNGRASPDGRPACGRGGSQAGRVPSGGGNSRATRSRRRTTRHGYSRDGAPLHGFAIDRRIRRYGFSGCGAVGARTWRSGPRGAVTAGRISPGRAGDQPKTRASSSG